MRERERKKKLRKGIQKATTTTIKKIIDFTFKGERRR